MQHSEDDGHAQIDEPAANSTTGAADARKSKKAVFRRTIDYNASVINYLKDRLWIYRGADKISLEPDYLWSPKLYPPKSYMECPMNCVMSKPVRTSTNKNKCPIYCVCWTPEGRRLITGAFSGEFTLWNGLTFNFETILQAHESQIRCMKWSHNDEWLLTADHSGYVKYWQANMNNVEMYQAHKEPIRGVSFCPFDNKFVTCSDDSTVRIWDFHRCAEERVLRGHGSDVRSVAWHPTLSLIISGSKDAQQPIKLWDPKTGESVTTLYIHKNTCTDVAWNDNGNWFLTASRDHLIKLFDLRCLKSELQTFRGHKRDVMRVAWHPFHECLFASGSADGSIFYWLAGTETELGAVENAHESMIWSLAWHPLGHILVSGANDFATKFWTRNRPGDVLKESSCNVAADGATGLTDHAVTDNSTAEQTGLSNDLLRSLAESSQFNALFDTTDELAFTTNPDDVSDVEIPGLHEGIVSDLNVIDTGDDGDDRIGNKLRGQRSIPRDFAANWASSRITTMPTVMLMPPAPSPTQLASAVAVAAAAVSDLTSTPQYLPPVKPPVSVTKDRSALSHSVPEPVRQKPASDHSQGVCTRPVRPMNYLGQPPELSESVETDSRIDLGGHWTGGSETTCLSDMNNGMVPIGPRHEDREPFGHPAPTQHPVEFQRHSEDRDYRSYERQEFGVPRPLRPPHFVNRPPFPPDRFGVPNRPPDGRGPPLPPPERHRNLPPVPVDHVPYDDRFDRHMADGRHHNFPGPRSNESLDHGWTDGSTHRFPAHFPPRRPPPSRFAPPPEPFHPDPSGKFYPPIKRQLPPPNLPPRHKYPRPDNHWGGPNQW